MVKVYIAVVTRQFHARVKEIVCRRPPSSSHFRRRCCMYIQTPDSSLDSVQTPTWALPRLTAVRCCMLIDSNGKTSRGREWSPVCPVPGCAWLSRSQTVSAHVFSSIKAKPTISLSLHVSRVHTFQSTDYEPMWFCAIPHLSGSIGSRASDDTSR